MNEFIVGQIKRQNSQIERLFDKLELEKEDYELNCSNIILRLRTLVEHIVTYCYGEENKIECAVSQETLRKVVPFMKKTNKNLCILHKFLQACSSHYVIDEVSSPRLLTKYMPYMVECKKFLDEKYNIKILNNINKFNIITTSGMDEYYEKINEVVEKYPKQVFEDNKARYYVYKSTALIINDRVLYETVVGVASNFASKFNRFIVFSSFRIDEKYAVKLNLKEDYIQIDNNIIPIKVALSYMVSIRPCELNNFGKLVGLNVDIKSHFYEYEKLMELLTNQNIGLHDIVLSNDEEFNGIINGLKRKETQPRVTTLLQRTRDCIVEKMYCKTVLKYLLINMKNTVIRDQYTEKKNYHGLYIKPQPFDDFPIMMSLVNHNTNLMNLFEIVDFNDREDEFFYRKIRMKTESEGVLYHSNFDLKESLENADSYLKMVNQKLSWDKKINLCKMGNFYYIKEYEESTKIIIDKLMELSEGYFQDYSVYIQNEIEKLPYKIDSDEKLIILGRLF